MPYLENTGLQTQLGFANDEEMKQYQDGDERYFEIVALAVREQLTYLEARGKMYAPKKVNAQQPSGNVYTYNKGSNFKETADLFYTMRDGGPRRNGKVKKIQK